MTRRSRTSSSYLGTITATQLDAVAADGIAQLETGGWKFYACGVERVAYVTSEPAGARRVWMLRKGQKVRFYDAAGEQVGPEHANVVPACCWAAGQGWIDPSCPDLSVACTLEVRGQLGR